ncbi:hypothetical protein NEIPOLOT_00351 [Neisseria polysaccharea ATCC 43768]|nr:hypothetical protein NEIPOLOT_00351 [Neisseria polysaccharea ATCC 43768]
MYCLRLRRLILIFVNPLYHSNGNVSQLDGTNREILLYFPLFDIMFIQYAV